MFNGIFGGIGEIGGKLCGIACGKLDGIGGMFSGIFCGIDGGKADVEADPVGEIGIGGAADVEIGGKFGVGLCGTLGVADVEPNTPALGILIYFA